MKNLYITISVILLTLILSGCGVKTDPGFVLDQMEISMSTIEQMEFSGEFSLTGDTNQVILEDLSDLTVRLDSKIDLADFENLKYLINFLVDGAGADGVTRLGAEVRSFADYNYFRVTDISMPLNLPFSLTTDDNWYKVKKSVSNGNNVLGVDPGLFTNKEFNQIRQLFRDSKFFVPYKILPDATVNSMRSYHIIATIDQEVLDRFIYQLDIIADGKLGIDKSFISQLLSSYQYNLWITREEYKLTKLMVNGSYVDRDNNDIGFEAEVNLTHFDIPMDITRPSNVQDFSLDHLFGLPLGSL